MDRIDIARRYLAAVAAADADAVCTLFDEDGVIDDFVGGHHVGHAGLRTFLGTWSAGEVGFSEPVEWIEEGDRLVVFGTVQRPGVPERDRVRWIFHLNGDRIAHLGNSKIESFPGDPA
jgi:ketosteroid isomerase-like protein